MLKKKKGGQLEKSDVWNRRSLIVPLIGLFVTSTLSKTSTTWTSSTLNPDSPPAHSLRSTVSLNQSLPESRCLSLNQCASPESKCLSLNQCASPNKCASPWIKVLLPESKCLSLNQCALPESKCLTLNQSISPWIKVPHLNQGTSPWISVPHLNQCASPESMCLSLN